jgi:hypothetical protein
LTPFSSLHVHRPPPPLRTVHATSSNPHNGSICVVDSYTGKPMTTS